MIGMGSPEHPPQSENPIEAVVLAIELLNANGCDFANIK